MFGIIVLSLLPFSLGLPQGPPGACQPVNTAISCTTTPQSQAQLGSQSHTIPRTVSGGGSKFYLHLMTQSTHC